jgi:hypothetical protein
VDAKRVATETEVATVVHQIKFEMVDWAQCRALFPSMFFLFLSGPALCVDFES